MNRIVKVGVAAFALAAVVPALADETETPEADEGVIGWTPVAVGLASPVQLPWGHAAWDVYGLDLGLLYYGAPKMYGLGLAFGATYTTDTMAGADLSAFLNWHKGDVYGVSATLGANISEGTTYGANLGGFAYRHDIWGLDLQFIGSFEDNMTGWQSAGIVNIAREQAYGVESAIGVNIAHLAYGLQIAAIFNMADELHGCQVGLVNFAQECPWGFQIGLVNIIMDNKLKVLPFFNAYF